MVSFLSGIGARLVLQREIAAYITPHLAHRKLTVAAATFLAFVAAGAGVSSALLMAAILQANGDGHLGVNGSAVDPPKPA